MATPLTNQLILGLGSPPTRQVRMPVSFGARIRFLGALTQNGAAVEDDGRGCDNHRAMVRRHYDHVPLTVTLMMWCAVPSLFVAMQR